LKIKYFSIILIVLAFLAGCANENKIEISTNDVQKIEFELIKTQNLNGAIVYTIKMTNGSDFVIKQNNVYVSYPVKTKTAGYQGNEYKVEAKGNKLNIQPGEKIIFHVIMPFDGIGDKSLLGIDNPSIQINGYLGKLDNKHRFGNVEDLIKK
jgi:DnaJ-class molecular chaperone